MENNIILGAIIGLVTASSLYVWNTKDFTKVQKSFLLIFLIFPPLQWVSILLISAYNKFKIENSTENKSTKKIYQNTNKLELAKESLQDLKNSGIINTDEYNEKVEKIEVQISRYNLLNTPEYNQLKYLFDSDILTKEEFESKVEILKNQKTDKNRIIIIKDYRIVDDYHEDLALVINDKLDYGFINAFDEVIIDFKFDYAENFSNGLALIRIKDKFGYINKKGHVEIALIYDEASTFSHNIAKVKIKTNQFYINSKGVKINNV